MANKAKIGRPTVYKPEYVELAQNYALLGATDEQMGKFFGVADRTFQKWKKKHPEFVQALKSGKADADANVAKSLYRRAIGYAHPAVKMFVVKDKDGNASVLSHQYVERYAPDPTSGIFWLKNRRPDVWRDKPVEITVDDDQMKDLLDAINGSPKE